MFTITNLLLPTFLIFSLGIAITYFVTRKLLLSIIIGVVKSLLFFLYFCFFYDGTFTLLDDLSYLRIANELIALHKEGNIPINPLELPAWFSGANGYGTSHFVYYYHNILSFFIIGYNGYFAPVAFNIILTFVAAVVIFKIASLLKLSSTVKNLLFIFFVLHWDIIVWSNFVNIKDILILCLVMCLCWLYFEIRSGKPLVIRLLSIIAIFILLEYLRYYLKFLIMFSLFLELILYLFKHKRMPIFIKIIIPVCVILTGIGYLFLFRAYDIAMVSAYFTNPIYGSIRFILTPIPIQVDPKYTFIAPAAWLHWLMLPVFLVGVVRAYFFEYDTIIKGFHLSILLLFFAFVLFYGTISELQGPRHRVQIAWVFILYQFYGLRFLICFNRGKCKESTPRGHSRQAKTITT